MNDTAEILPPNSEPSRIPAIAAKGAIPQTLAMVSKAVAAGASVEVITQLVSLHERLEANQARHAFDNAMANAKANIPTIRKNRQVGFESKKGGSSTQYKHEDLAEISRTVDAHLAAEGLSYRFRTSSKPNEPVSVTCIISHRDGHSEENSLSSGVDASGNKNSIQAIGSAITYLQRYTLKAALGLAASNEDDGKRADEPSEPLIESEVFDKIRALLKETGTEEGSFLGFFKVDSLADLPAKKASEALFMLNKRLTIQREKAPKQ